jgi:hypothetical protein
VGAIFRDEDLPAEVAEFETINQLWFVDKQAAREKVESIVQRGSTIT